MKDIKFRYVYTDGKEFKYFYYTLENIEEGYIKRDFAVTPRAFKLIARDRCIGTKNENGQEVYENDIIPLVFPCTKTNAKVIFSESQSAFVPLSKYQTIYRHNFFRSEVIGNTHEHKHLLEDK